MNAETLVREGKLEEALAGLKQAVRDNAADPKLRVFLFQLLAVRGEWDKALTQLHVSGDLDPASMLMVQTYQIAVQAEAYRRDIFSGKRTPMVFGEPEPWIGHLVQALHDYAAGNADAAAAHRAKAFEDAPAVPCTVDGTACDWLADMDERLGPVFEAIIDGKYYWVPMNRVAHLHIEEPTDLRDVIWIPGVFTWTNGGESHALLFARYPGSENSTDEHRLARGTAFEETLPGTFTGLGQRMFAGGEEEFPMLAVRSIEFQHEGAGG